MQRRITSTLLSLIGAAALAGCGARTADPAPASQTATLQNAKPEPVLHLSANGGGEHVATNNLADHNLLREDVDIVLQLDIYQLTVPCGAISSNDKFWNHIDEDHVDLTTHALLLKNGVRYGIGPNDDWDYFKGLIDHYGATAKKGSTAPTKQGKLELPLRNNIDTQDVFYFDYHNDLYGRTYERCDDLLALSFEPTPRRPGDSRIAMCALVRGVRKEIKVTILNEVRVIEQINPEYLYDLRLCQDVPLDHFMVIAPSPTTYLPHNLGHTFFIRPGGAEPTETILLLVPRPYRITGSAPNVPLNRVTPGTAK